MKNFIQEFKVFALKGNVVDLAVAVVVGAAFGRIVSSLVENIVMPLVGALIGGINFTTLTFTVGEAVVTYGVFLQSIFDFVVIALAVFVAIRMLARLKKKEEEKPVEEKVAKPSEEVQLLQEIRDALTQSR